MTTKKDEALLGLATTSELLDELRVRMQMLAHADRPNYVVYGRKLQRACAAALDELPQSLLDYRTVDA